MPPLQEPKVLKYWALVEHLREQIADGRLSPGARVPSLAQMQAEFQVSRATVEKAFTLLEQDGLLLREQGRGTFVGQKHKPRATRTLGLVLHVDSLANFYIMELLEGVRTESARQKLRVLWLNDGDVSDCSNVDAIMMYCHPTEALAFNLPLQIPHTLWFHHSPDFTCVSADDFTGAKLATQHLFELGHSRIAYLLWSADDSLSRQRLAGYQSAHEEANVQSHENFIRFLQEPRTLSYDKSVELTMQRWLAEDWRELGCTAILAHNDEAAVSVIRVLREHGLRVPEDVSVVGFDGTRISELSTPELTTIKVPLQAIGASAVKVLAAQIQQGVPPEPQKIVLPVQLQAGATTAPAKSIHEAFVSFPN